MMKTAIITGITGQDGSLLARYLLSKNYVIIAPTRKNPITENLKILKILDHQYLRLITYKNKNCFKKIIKRYQAEEFYHLAAKTHVGDSHKKVEKIFTVNTTWTVKLLSYIEKYSSKTRFFFASTSEIYDKNQSRTVDEGSIKQANTPYGISKLAAHQMVEYYRNIKNLYACNGILFNHESELRPANFVSMKIFKNVARIVKNGGHPLELGNIEAQKDWGYAADYIPAFHKALNQQQASDYVLATGRLYSVKQLVESSFKALNFGIKWQGTGVETIATDKHGNIVVKINPEFFRPLDDGIIVGQSNRAKNILGWQQLTPFNQWVEHLTKNEFRKISQ